MSFFIVISEGPQQSQNQSVSDAATINRRLRSSQTEEWPMCNTAAETHEEEFSSSGSAKV